MYIFIRTYIYIYKSRKRKRKERRLYKRREATQEWNKGKKIGGIKAAR